MQNTSGLRTCILLMSPFFSRMSIPAATTYISRHETFISQQQLNATQKSKRLNINIMATDTDSHASSGSQYLQDVLGDVLGTQHTVWKFQDFSVTQILREIIFAQSTTSKTAVFAILGALNFVNFRELVNTF